MTSIKMYSNSRAITISSWSGYTVFKIKRKMPSVLGWQLEGWSSSNRGGEGCRGIGLKAMIWAEITKVSLHG